MVKDMQKDSRFSNLSRDPKYKPIPKEEKKVKIDERFKSVRTDKKFQINSTVDKRGAVINPISSQGMEKFYHYSDESDDDEDDKNNKDDDDEDEDESDESNVIDKKDLIENKKQLKLKNKKVDGKLDNDTKKKLQDLTFDYARGEKQLFSDDSSDDSSDDDDDKVLHDDVDNDEDEDEEIEHQWGELDKEAGTTETITSRLAACNMDWDRIRAIDLMVLFNSFLQAGGFVHSVNIYPSEYGLKRLQEEEIKGPIELVDSKKENEKNKKNNNDSDDSDNDDDDDNNDNNESDGNDSQNEEGSAYTMEKMRQYQLNRLKYYYAVIKFDSPETANKIYTECDGIEYESTSTKLDLRFIPDDMEFDQEPKETCNKLPDPTKYMPRLFTTTALQQVKVDLTWDETKPERQEITNKINSGKINEIDENDINAYLGSGSSDDDDDNDNDDDKEKKIENENEEIKNKFISNDKKTSLNKYRSLLQSIKDKDEEKKKKDVGIEFTWSLGVKEKADKALKDQLKQKEISKLSIFEQKTEKIKEKKKLKRQEKRQLKEQKNNEDDDDESDDSIPSDVDMNDPFFADEIKNLKPKKNNNKVDKNKKNKKVESNDDDDDDKKAKKQAELELLLLNNDDQLEKHHFNMKDIEENDSMAKSKKKRLIKKKKVKKAELDNEDTFKVDVEDSRFAALYNSHHFNIDPADPHYRKTKGTEEIIQEKLKRRAEDDVSSELPAIKISKPSKEDKLSKDLEALIKSVKKNTKNITKKIK